MPPWMLAWFGKADLSTDGTLADGDAAEGVDPETFLTQNDIVELDPETEDYVLTEAFRADWQTAVKDAPEDVAIDDITPLFDMEESGEYHLETRDDRVRVVDDEDTASIAWPSPAAVRADVATDAVLSSWDLDWERYTPYERASIYEATRIVIDECPNGDETVLDGEVRESCCSEMEVAVVRCSDSGARIAEQPV
jgi:hypothetical protein